MKKLKPLKQRLTKATLARLKARKITNMEAAIQYEVSETHLSRIVAAMQTKVPGTTAPARAAAKRINDTRRQLRTVLAKRVMKGRLKLADAAAQAGCSERTISRYIAAYTK